MEHPLQGSGNSRLRTCIEGILQTVSIIDDDFTFPVGADEVGTVGVPPRLGRFPESETPSTNEGQTPDSPGVGLPGFGSWLGMFVSHGILPIPFFYTADLDSRLGEILSLTDFTIIDHFLPGNVSARTVVERYCRRTEQIRPVVVISKDVDAAAAEFASDTERFTRDEGFGQVPCFRLANSGAFVQVYSKSAFSISTVRRNVISYIERRYSAFSILAMDYHAGRKRNARAVMPAPLGSNMDAALLMHAHHNHYREGYVRQLLCAAYADGTLTSSGFDPEPVFLARVAALLRAKARLEPAKLQQCFVDSLRLYTEGLSDKKREAVGEHFKGDDRGSGLADALSELSEKCASMDSLLAGIELASRGLTTKARGISTNDEDVREVIERAIIHAVLATQPGGRTGPDLLRNALQYRLTPVDRQHDMWDVVCGYRGGVFGLIENGEFLVHRGSEAAIVFGPGSDPELHRVVGCPILCCVTPSCDIMRPEKVGYVLKFTAGVQAQPADCSKVERLAQRSGFHRLVYYDTSGERQTILLNFGHVTSKPLPPVGRDEPAIQAAWAGWRSLLRLQPGYAHELLNKYVSYQARSGVEDVDW